MHQEIPGDINRVLIAALRGGSGKTVISVGIIAALARAGKTVAPFKKGPDYIDAGWLSLAAGRPCHNLDSFLFPQHLVSQSFAVQSRDSDIAVIEGNRGLYDGLDAAGSTSSAAIAKLLQAPVILCIDCTKSTRTMAALVMGCMQFDPGVNIAAVIANRVAGSRHENLVRECIESYCKIPVIGAIPKLSGKDFPERHMGLIPSPEHLWASASIDSAASMAKNHIDLEAVCRIASDFVRKPVRPCSRDNEAGNENVSDSSNSNVWDIKRVSGETGGLSVHGVQEHPRIGIVRDSAFQFYYPENLDAISAAGGKLIYISPLAMESLPEIDALYIGGGFPETHAEKLSKNFPFRDSVKSAAAGGLPIYAECGGLMYLGESLVFGGETYPMAGVLPVVFGFSGRPQGHGYTIVAVSRENPYFPKEMELNGHEFHYSRVIEWKGSDSDLVFTMKKGRGFINSGDGPKDGICRGNILATYTHLHALGCPQWAKSFVKLAAAYSKAEK